MTKSSGAENIRVYTLSQISSLLDRVVYHVSRAAKSPDEKRVHEARVSIRRFVQALRFFRQFIPGEPSKRIRKRLKSIMNLSAEVRSRDIALHLLEESEAPDRTGVRKRMELERKVSMKELAAALRRLNRRNYSVKWRESLRLEA
ncbi:MAG TPA: CHAD domain-containing protein [Bryobacteraceae bacterium]|nr:CHAD domain-containing protein [Bryobacteraceae bacterium]